MRHGILSYRGLYFLGALFSLLSGISVYFLFRNSHLLIFDWFNRLEWLNGFYIHVSTKESIFLSVLIYNVPDGLWLLSGILLIRALWCMDKKWCEVYILVFCLIAVGLELLQLPGVIPGTFDLIDLVLMVSIAFIEGIIFRYFIRRRIV